MLTSLECAEYFVNQPEWITGGDDTQYYIERKDDGEVVIVFAESNSKVDWKNNFSFWKKPYRDMEVPFFCHGGFLKCWKLVRDEIANIVVDMRPTAITVTGWSYGGAIATFCIEDMWFRYPALRNKMQCVTFGAPRVIGWWNYRKIKERWESQRLFTNGADIVTCVPFIFMMFRHVHEQIHIGDLRKFWRFFRPGKYHLINNYIDSIKQITK